MNTRTDVDYIIYASIFLNYYVTLFVIFNNKYYFW